ncbi:hypothetical protein E4191_07165 [Paracoccus liaowanqingii]|uniref:Uncharacterized protein n=1 Tax=Paracoccus liaowanqingii TaxID=2560053 RepID=A0A4P7HK81_9RHOB|nr:hypothetical protein [Paracoccus liaowanqingii]QBX34516.1 hypothetical protein E4191_07165 [Paracoccus liaowanqingii]
MTSSTALTEFQRLEAQGSWRERPDARLREVIVSVGEATLTMMDPKSDRPLSHWSLPAVTRLNPGRLPALYTPSSTAPDETVEIEDPLMIEAIERVQRAIAAHRATPGRLRGVVTGAAVLVMLAGLVFWLPDALIRHAARIAPPAQARNVGLAVLADLERSAGAVCRRTSGQQVLDWMSPDLIGADALIQVVPGPLNGARRLPGDLYVLGSDLLTTAPGPEAAAGHLVATRLAVEDKAVTLDALRHAGLMASLRLMTLGTLPRDAMEGLGEAMLAGPVPRPDLAALPPAFAPLGLSTEPYARSIDPTGAAVLPLIEADPIRAGVEPADLLTDAQWLALQQICAG